jgi:surfeit locus 1 family protein
MARWKLTLALLAGVLSVLATLELGNWQTRRGDEKAARQRQWDAALAGAPVRLADAAGMSRVADSLPQRVEAVGTFVTNATVYLDNRLVDGVAGFHVITPLSLGDDVPWIMVNRGWAARSMYDRGRLPEARVDAGPVRVEGVAVDRVPRALELGERENRLGGIWQNLDFAAFEQASGRPVGRFVVQQTNDTGDGLQRNWTRPDTGVDKHRGYAFQWYSLTALIAALTLFFGGKALRKT